MADNSSDTRDRLRQAGDGPGVGESLRKNLLVCVETAPARN
jgi:hypothetical protein